jgi:hypothetical protein
MADTPTRRTRLGAAAGILGAAAAFTLVVGAGPAPSVFQLAGADDVSGPCDEAEHADDPACGSTSTTVDDGTTTSTIDDGTTTSTTTAPAPDDPTSVRSIDAAGAGTVVVAVEGTGLRLVAATPAPGWQAEVEHGTGREIEVDFRSGTQRVQVNVELEDGQVRERVRVRDDADGTDVRTEAGTIVRDDTDDRSGPGGDDDDTVDDSSGPGGDDTVDDHGGSGPGGDDSHDDDDGSSGHGGGDG